MTRIKLRDLILPFDYSQRAIFTGNHQAEASNINPYLASFDDDRIRCVTATFSREYPLEMYHFWCSSYAVQGWYWPNCSLQNAFRRSWTAWAYTSSVILWASEAAYCHLNSVGREGRKPVRQVYGGEMQIHSINIVGILLPCVHLGIRSTQSA